MKMSNFWVRTLTGIVFLAVMVFGLIWDRTAFGALFVIILWVALQEFYRMALGGRMMLQQKLGLATGAMAFLFVAGHCFYGWSTVWLMLPLLTLLLIPASSLLLPSLDGFGELTYIYTGLLYIALPVSLSPLIMMDGEVYDGWLMLSLFILIWMTDVGAYCVGSLVGLLGRYLFLRSRGGRTAFPDLASVPAAPLPGTRPARQRRLCVRGSVRIDVETPFRRQGFRQLHPRTRRHAGSF